jgi:hypothetical protein
VKLARLETMWRTDDPEVAATLARIMDETDPIAKHEMLAQLHILQARWEWRDADRLRSFQREAERRRQRECSICHEPGHTRRTCTSALRDVPTT